MPAVKFDFAFDFAFLPVLSLLFLKKIFLHLAVITTYSWIFIQISLLVGLKGTYKVSGIEPETIEVGHMQGK